MPASIPFEIFAQAIPNQVWSATSDGQLDWFNDQVFAYSGLAYDDLAGTKWAQIVHPDDIDRAVQGWSNALSDGSRYQTEFRLKRHDGEYHWHLARALPIRDATGKITRWVGTNTDIEDQKAAQAQQRLLARELQHRMKNSMAVVGAIARQTFRKATSMEEAEAALSGRLNALSEAHDILTNGDWLHTTMTAVVEQALSSHRSGEGRISIAGPPAELSPKRALSLAMALHELATNAVKYGSLSTLDGRLEVTWRYEGVDAAQTLHFRWEESDGPSVSPPSRRGFGSQLIEATLAADFGNTLKVDYQPSGLVCTFAARVNEA